jgi:YbbR domain-containing protein
VSVQPVTVVIAGPRTLLQGIDHVDTVDVTVAGVRADVVSDAKLVLPDGVTIADGQSTAKITVTIKALTGSSTYSVGILLIGTSGTLSYGLSNASTLVVVSGPVTALNGLVGSTLQAVADVTGLGEGTHTVTLNVAVPSGLKVTSILPRQVTVTITSAATPTPSPTP